MGDQATSGQEIFEDELMQRAVDHVWTKKILPSKIRAFVLYLVTIVLFTAAVILRVGFHGEQHVLNAGIRGFVQQPHGEGPLLEAVRTPEEFVAFARNLNDDVGCYLDGVRCGRSRPVCPTDLHSLPLPLSPPPPNPSSPRRTPPSRVPLFLAPR